MLSTRETRGPDVFPQEPRRAYCTILVSHVYVYIAAVCQSPRGINNVMCIRGLGKPLALFPSPAAFFVLTSLACVILRGFAFKVRFWSLD